MRIQGLWAVLLLSIALPAALTQAEEPPAEPAFEVLVVGTIHAPWQFRTAGFHPGHVRAALEAAKPDVVGVESNRMWFSLGRFHDVTYEAQRVAVPWANARDIPVRGIDWMDRQAWQRRTDEKQRRWAANLRKAPGEGRFGFWAFGQVDVRQLPKTYRYFAADDRDFRHVNDIDSNRYGRKWMSGAGRLRPFGGRRNDKIASRCVEVMKDHPGKRLVVVIGAGHKAVLDEILSRRRGVKVLSWGREVPPPSEEAAERALTNEDRLVILGHNLDGERSYFHPQLVDLDRMARVLDAYADGGGHPRVVEYFAARVARMQGEDVIERLRALGTEGGEPPRLYPFPLGHWRMAYDLEQAIRLELARALLTADGKSEAAPILSTLAEELPEPRGSHGTAWEMAYLARAYPRFLLEERPARPVAATVAPSSWRAFDPAHGALAVVPDADALRVRLVHPKGVGKPYAARSFPVTTSGGTWRFRARVKTAGVESVRVVAYVWPEPRRAEEIASQVVQPGPGAWQEVDLSIPVPVGRDTVGIHVYAARSADGTLWLQDVRMESVR